MSILAPITKEIRENKSLSMKRRKKNRETDAYEIILKMKSELIYAVFYLALLKTQIYGKGTGETKLKINF